MKFIIGKKKEMSQIFHHDNGKMIPVTIIEAGPCVVTQIKTAEKNKYDALQIGFGRKKKINKPLKGHLKKTNVNCRYLCELRDTEAIKGGSVKVGVTLGVEMFKEGDLVDISGVSKGRGFQGVVKRHKFAGSPATHGHKDQLRMPGSIGATDPAHVFKGTRMAGRMGGQYVTAKNLEVVKIDDKNNLLYIKGAVPGARNELIKIKGQGDLKIRETKEENADAQEEAKTNEQEIKS